MKKNNKKSRFGIEPLLSGAIYIGIVVVAIGIVLGVAMPAIEKMQDIAAFDQAKDALASLDQIIRQVASEGEGSTRIIPLEFRKGELYINESTNRIFYALETLAKVVSPRTSIQIGNLIFAANAEVNVSANNTHFIMKNSHLRVAIKRIGNATDYSAINASQLIDSIYLIDKDRYFNGSVLIEFVGDTLNYGTGYTYPEELGWPLGHGRIIGYVETDTSESYEVWFTLESGADFLTIEIKNYGTI